MIQSPQASARQLVEASSLSYFSSRFTKRNMSEQVFLDPGPVANARPSVLVDDLPVAISHFENGKCVYVNRYWSQLTGRPVESALGLGFLEAVHPEDRSQLQESLAKIPNGPPGEVVVMDGVEVRYLKPDGTVSWLLSKHQISYSADGTQASSTSTEIDITQRKELEQQQLRQTAILEATTDYICVASMDLKIMWLNKRLLDLRPDLDPKMDADCMSKYSLPSQEIVREIGISAAIENGTWSGEVDLVDLDGNEIPVSLVLVAHKSQNGSVEYFSGIMRDISAIKVANLALQKSQQALQETQTHLQVMTDNIPSMLFRYVRYPDESHEALFVTPECREIYELEPSDAIEDIDLVFQRIHPEDLPQLEASAEESERNLTSFTCEYRVILPKKGLRWVQSIGKPSRRDDGAVVYDGLVIDITQRKEWEIELQKAKMKDEFLANVSHELRTPLNAMLGMTEGLQEGIFGPVTAKQLEGLKVVEQSGAHLLDLINEMLDLAKIESGEMELNFSAVNVQLLCESSLRFVTSQADKKNIQLNLNVPWNVPKIKVDEKRMRQVLINLLDNAVKFTPEGGSVTVEVQRLQPADNQDSGATLQLAVVDTGIGIESAQLESLFVPFFQVDSALNRQYEGTGLGLALVKQYVELHGGKVSVSSDQGSGSCFKLEIPYREISAEHVSSSESALDISNNSGALIPEDLPEKANQSLLVLLCEDNKDIALVVSIYLEAIGFRVIHASNGEMGVEQAIEHSPDVILMDIQMPGVDGLVAIQRLRQIPAHSKTPIVAVTGLARSVDAQRCIAAGADEYLSKPYKMNKLAEVIRKLTNQFSDFAI